MVKSDELCAGEERERDELGDIVALGYLRLGGDVDLGECDDAGP